MPSESLVNQAKDCSDFDLKTLLSKYSSVLTIFQRSSSDRSLRSYSNIALSTHGQRYASCHSTSAKPTPSSNWSFTADKNAEHGCRLT